MALAISTGIGAVASLLLGKIFDRSAMATLATAVVLSSFAAAVPVGRKSARLTTADQIDKE